MSTTVWLFLRNSSGSGLINGKEPKYLKFSIDRYVPYTACRGSLKKYLYGLQVVILVGCLCM